MNIKNIPTGNEIEVALSSIVLKSGTHKDVSFIAVATDEFQVKDGIQYRKFVDIKCCDFELKDNLIWLKI